MQVRRLIASSLILAGLFMLITSVLPTLPFAIVWRTPTYTSDAIILYDGPIPTLKWDAETEDYSTQLYFEVNFNPPNTDTQYYFIIESSSVNPPVMWTLFFRNLTTGGALDGCGAWIPTVAEKYSGIELPGYYLIKWTFHREGTHYVSLTLRCKETPTPSGTIKAMFKWTILPTPTYAIEIINVTCAGVGSNIIIYGKISPPVGGKDVKVSITYPDGSKQTRIARTIADGTFFIDNPYDPIANQKGAYTVQATVDTTTSNPKTVEIGITPPTPALPTRQILQIIGVAALLIGVIILLAEKKA